MDQKQGEQELLLPVGIDLGSYYARVSIIPNISTLLQENENSTITPDIIANPQTGLRYTLALSTIEDADDSNKNHYIFGDIAYRHLSRTCNSLNDIHNKLFVRSLSSCGSIASDSDDGKESNDDINSSIAFFEYLCDIAYQAYNNSNNNTTLSATSLRIVLSLPSYIPEKERSNIKDICNDGIMSYIQQKEGKRKKKEYCKKFGTAFVVGIICDSSSLCIAHDLTTSTCSDKWNYTWCMNWGNSGYTITVYKNHNGILQRLTIGNHQHNPNLSTKCIQVVLQQFVIQQFLQKNRLSMSTFAKIQSNTKAMYKLHVAIEDTLRTFVRMNTVNIHIDGFYDGIDLNMQMSRPRLDMLLSNVFKNVQYMITCNQQLFVEKYGGDIDVVLVSGCGFQMPNMDQMLQSSFPKSRIVMNTSSCGINIPCDEVVAIGCAKYAYHILYHDYGAKKEIDNEEECNNKLCTSSMDVPTCPFSIAIAYCKDSTNNGSFTLMNDDGTVNESWTIVSFMDSDTTILPFNNTKSISFSSDEEIPCCYYVIQSESGKNTDTTIHPLAKITVDKEDILNEPNQMFDVSLDIDKDYKVQFTLNNTGECVSL